MDRLLGGLPSLDALPKLQEIAKLKKLGRVRELPLPPEKDPVDQQASDTFPTQAEFDAAFAKWGQGTKAEFSVYHLLIGKYHMEPWRDFQLMSSTWTGSSPLFYVGRFVWRIRGDQIIEKPSALKLQKLSLTKQGHTVVDMHAQDLQFGLANATVTAAFQGREVRSF